MIIDKQILLGHPPGTIPLISYISAFYEQEVSKWYVCMTMTWTANMKNEISYPRTANDVCK